MILVVGAIAVYTWLASQPAAAPPVIGGAVTAHQAFPVAAELATQWQRDALLLSASAQWLQPNAQQDGKSIEWAFQFFSPSVQQVVIINVHDGTAGQIDHFYTSPMPTFSNDDWQIDSDEAWLTWLDSGGRSMLARHPDTTLAMTLRLPGEDEVHPVWQVGGVVTGKRSALVIVVDATDGTILSQ
jgi:hypothetical protein